MTWRISTLETAIGFEQSTTLSQRGVLDVTKVLAPFATGLTVVALPVLLVLLGFDGGAEGGVLGNHRIERQNLQVGHGADLVVGTIGVAGCRDGQKMGRRRHEKKRGEYHKEEETIDKKMRTTLALRTKNKENQDEEKKSDYFRIDERNNV